jgi:DNA-binding NarL/FixJ family response regulator
MSHSSAAREDLSLLVLDPQNLVHIATCPTLHIDCSITAYEARTSAEAVVLAQAVQPDVVLLDIGDANYAGLTLIHQLLADPMNAVLLVCSAANTVCRLATTLDEGVPASFTVSTSVTPFIDAVRRACGAQLMTDPEVVHHCFRTWHQHAFTAMVPDTIQRPSLKVLVLAWRGGSNRSIGKQLKLSEQSARPCLQTLSVTASLAHRTQLALQRMNTECLHMVHYAKGWISRSWRRLWQAGQYFTASPSVGDATFASTKTGSQVRPFHRLST